MKPMSFETYRTMQATSLVNCVILLVILNMHNGVVMDLVWFIGESNSGPPTRDMLAMLGDAGLTQLGGCQTEEQLQ